MLKNIYDILVAQGAISREQLADFTNACTVTEKEFYACAQRFGVAEAAVAEAYAQLFDYVYVSVISERMADVGLLARVPLRFLRDNTVMPLFVGDGPDRGVTVVVAYPFNYQPIDELRLIFDFKVTLAVAPPSIIIDALNRYYPLEGTQRMIEELEEDKELSGDIDLASMAEEDILGMASEAPIIKLVNHMLHQAIKRGASDIHLEPFEKELRIRYRIDGVLYLGLTPPKRAQAAIASRIKIMANLNIAEKRQPQDGRIQIKIADKAFDIRVSVLPVAHGERIVMRLLDKTKTFGKLAELGMSTRDYDILQQTMFQPNGIALITGPTGSGKTSTLYAMLSQLNTPEVNIITVEDPIEYQMAGIGQVQVREKIGLTFAAALRSILRQDPDIIMIGETRDQETAQIAIQAALTGHLVLSTLHTNSAAAAITRLIDMGIEPFLIASTVVSVVAQRLVRRLCEHCKQAYIPEAAVLDRLSIDAKRAQSIVFYKPVGCDECLSTGYRGRLPIFEIMVMTPAIARLTIQRADTVVLQEQALKDGMTLLVHDGVRRIEQGITTPEEVLSVATSAEGIGE